jgi:hypothetical protein
VSQIDLTAPVAVADSLPDVEQIESPDDLLGAAPSESIVEKSVVVALVSQPIVTDTPPAEVVAEPLEEYTYIPIIPVEQSISVVRDWSAELAVL